MISIATIQRFFFKKKTISAGDVRQSRSRLEQEYIFIGVISTFLRAIRAGAVHVRHGAVLLAHYGRLSSTFDECSKVMVDVLREEGMYNGNPEVVVSVVTQAVREVCVLRSLALFCILIYSSSVIYVGD